MVEKLRRLLVKARFIPYAVAISAFTEGDAEAQTFTQFGQGANQAIQIIGDILTAGVGLLGIYFAARGVMALSKSGVDTAREKRGHNIWSDFGAAVGCFALTAIIYMGKNQLFGSGSGAAQPTLTAPNLTVTTGG